ncbi:MAG: lysophospholipid acyltransferase family protein [Pseudomonadota bacterium]
MTESQLDSANISSSTIARVAPNKLLATLRGLALIVWIVCGASVMAIARLFGIKRWIRNFPLIFHGVVARYFFGIRVEYEGTLRTDRPTLYVANHASYIDVFVLGGKIPGAFVAKSEVSGWPIFGQLAKLQNTMFLERKSTRAASQITQVKNWVHNETNLILFPEGTSTSGDWVAPFRSSLFAAAENVYVQPVTVAYLDYRGEPMGKADRDYFAWYLPDPKVAVPNTPFAAHFFNGLGLGPSRAKVVFHDPVLVEVGGRKQAAELCATAVRSRLEELLV